MVERLGEELGTAAMGDVAVAGVITEKVNLGEKLLAHGLVRVDVLLRAIYDADEAELEGVHATGEDVQRVGAGVHEVELGEHANRAPSLRVDVARELERVRVGEVHVGRADGEDHAGRRTGQHFNFLRQKRDEPVGLGDVVKHEISDLTLNIGGLIPDRDLGEAGKVDQREIEHFRRVDLCEFVVSWLRLR